MAPVPEQQPTADRAADFVGWRHRREADLADPHGWLSIVGLYWLSADDGAVDGVPGRFRLTADGGAEFRPAVPVVDTVGANGLGVTGPLVGTGGDGIGAAAAVTVAATGEPVGQSHTSEVAEGGTLNWLRYGELVIELIRRTGRTAIRVRDPDATTRTRFRGVPTFEPQGRWQVPARFHRLSAPRRVSVGAAQPGLTHRYTVIGTVDFDIERRPQQLLVFGQPDGGALILFHDSTNGRETAEWRSLTFRPPDVDGAVTLDFNRALNLPFVFTAFGTCPRPPEENVITVRVTAGEKVPLAVTLAA